MLQAYRRILVTTTGIQTPTNPSVNAVPNWSARYVSMWFRHSLVLGIFFIDKQQKRSISLLLPKTYQGVKFSL